MGLPVALQLYTVRDRLKEDFSGTLKKIAAIGYDAVELAGLYGHSAAEVREILDSLNLKAVGAHIGIDALKSDIDQQIADAKALGYANIIVPYIDGTYRSVEGYKKLADLLNTFASPIADAGLALAYHNHDFEFAALPGETTGFDILLDQTESNRVNFELDLFWIKKAGHDPKTLAASLASRVPLLHIKDMADTPERGFAEVGTGIIDYQPIVDAAPQWITQAFVIEQDNGWIDGDPIKSVTISHDNFRKLL